MIDYILDDDGILGHFVYKNKGSLKRGERWEQCVRQGRALGISDHQWKRNDQGGYTTNWQSPSHAQVKAWIARRWWKKCP
jgi:hypothetical protein